MQGQLVNELKIMYSISHNNIVGIYNHFEDDENCYLVIEYAGGGQVYSKMMSKGAKRFSEPEAAKMVYELCLALDYLHKRSIIHRDIKPENLLLSDKTHNATLKLADFGWSNFENGNKKRETYCGTVDYLAPEMADRQHKHDRGVDIWCVGVLIFELLTGRAPFSPAQKPGVTVNQAKR
jgi:serine/threonine protein kinase